MNYTIALGDSQMIELPDGSYIEIDCRDESETLITHWVEGDPIKSMVLVTDPE